MKKTVTITCHDVYNAGASLQAYALQKYLISTGFENEIIDYKPEYLKHYRLLGINNPKFDKPFFREAYQLLKLPGRIKARQSQSKKAFDEFTSCFLKVSRNTYESNKELQDNPPAADIYIAGSDQIWNPVFKNGKDPSFFLQFVPKGKRCISYAASFSVEEIPEELQEQMQRWLSKFDYLSVREASGCRILEHLGLEGIQVCDPVFLLNKAQWADISLKTISEPYLFVYDFDQNPIISKAARQIAQESGLKIVSAFPMDSADVVLNNPGPLEFIGAVQHAEFVISNSFHATAFSLIFQREFLVVNRVENINTRMRDLLIQMGLQDRLISVADYKKPAEINWSKVECRMKACREISTAYLDKALNHQVKDNG